MSPGSRKRDSTRKSGSIPQQLKLGFEDAEMGERPSDESERDFFQARKLYADIFDAPLPGSGQDMERVLRKRLREWKVNLESYRAAGKKGIFPGRREIDETLWRLREILLISRTDEFFNALFAQAGSLGKAQRSYPVLKDFYEHRIGLWEDLIRCLEDAEPNREEILGLAQGRSDLEALEETAALEDPWDRLEALPFRISRIDALGRGIRDEKVAAARNDAVTGVDGKIERISALLLGSGASPEVRNKALYELRRIRKMLAMETDLSGISDLLDKARDRYDEAVDLVSSSSGPLRS